MAWLIYNLKKWWAMGKRMKITLAIASIMAGSSASAKFVAGEYAQSGMTYTTLDQVRTSRTSAYTGVGSLFVSTVSTQTTGFGSLCTGSLISNDVVLTAAHCLSSEADNPVTSISFFLPSYGASADTTRRFTASAFAINSDYAVSGLAGGSDVAAFTISGNTDGYDKYGLYSGNPFQNYTEIGTGTVGGPRGTNIGIGSDFLKRVGNNMYEYYGSDIFSDSTEGVALYDFDDGTKAHDVFGQIGGNVQLGVDGESSASPGDSGGPEFIDGKIASVTSFGITGGIFNGYCGADSIDPFNNKGETAKTNLADCTNFSVGEIGGNTLVSYNMNFIQGYLDGTVKTMTPVPEPATWWMMLAGFGGIGAAIRKRGKLATVANHPDKIGSVLLGR